jgi:hypothetical protein
MSIGPYETERDTRQEPMPQQVRALRADHHHDRSMWQVVRDTVERHLLDACASAGVDLGDYDRRIITWLAEGEIATAQVVIGLITRARAAGRPDDELWTSDQARQWLAERHGRPVAAGTWRGYVSRDGAPAPVRRRGRTPLWDPDQVRAWDALRRGQSWRAGTGAAGADSTDTTQGEQR